MLKVSHIAQTAVRVVKVTLTLFNTIMVLALIHQTIIKLVPAVAIFEAVFERASINSRWLDKSTYFLEYLPSPVNFPF